MTERFAEVGNLRLCYETIGQPNDPAVLLITGLGGQLIHWPREFCQALAARGFFVIRYDNRDAGRSSVLSHLGTPSRIRLVLADGRDARYSLVDMARDGVGLLDALGIGAAHVVGISLGGILAQTMAVHYPERVHSLVSMSANTGMARDHPKLPVRLGMVQRPPRKRDRFISQTVFIARLFAPQTSSDDVRRLAAVQFDRGLHPEGSWRQLAAIFAAGDRTAELAAITAPTTVIHGTSDRVLPVTGGEATAAAVPGAQLHLIPGMGHELPRQHWQEFVGWVVANARRVEAG